jgi:hypothetical protein
MLLSIDIICASDWARHSFSAMFLLTISSTETSATCRLTLASLLLFSPAKIHDEPMIKRGKPASAEQQHLLLLDRLVGDDRIAERRGIAMLPVSVAGPSSALGPLRNGFFQSITGLHSIG